MYSYWSLPYEWCISDMHFGLSSAVYFKVYQNCRNLKKCHICHFPKIVSTSSAHRSIKEKKRFGVCVTYSNYDNIASCCELSNCTTVVLSKKVTHYLLCLPKIENVVCVISLLIFVMLCKWNIEIRTHILIIGYINL